MGKLLTYLCICAVVLSEIHPSVFTSGLGRWTESICSPPMNIIVHIYITAFSCMVSSSSSHITGTHKQTMDVKTLSSKTKSSKTLPQGIQVTDASGTFY